MLRKISVVLGVLTVAMLAACQGGQVELPNPGESNDTDADPNPVTNPVFGLAVGDSSQNSPSADQVNFNVPWTAVDANPNSEVTNQPLIYFAILNGSEGPAIRDTTRNPPMSGNRVQGSVDLSLSSEEYEAFCGHSVSVFAAINPTASELPAGNSVGDGYQAIEEADIRLPGGMAQQYQDTVDIVCEEELTASFNGGSVEEGQTLGIDSSSTGSPEEYKWSAQNGSIRGSGQSVTYVAPEISSGIVSSDTVTLTVSRGQEQASASRDILVRNTDYELPTPGPGPGPSPRPSPGQPVPR